jgi:hypothetical protein
MSVDAYLYSASCHETKRLVIGPNGRFDQGSSDAQVSILFINNTLCG